MWTPPRLPAATVVGLAVAFLAIATSGAMAQLRSTVRPLPLSRHLPGTDLVFLAEFDGLDAHAAAWRRTSLYSLLNQTKLGAMIEDLATQAIDQATAAAPPSQRLKGAEMLKLVKAAVQSGFAVSATQSPGVGGMAIRNGAKNGIRAVFEAQVKAAGGVIKIETRGNRKISTVGSGVGETHWWTEGDDLILTGGPGREATLAVVERKAPPASSSPVRAELARVESGFEPALVAFVNITKIPISPNAKSVGIDGLKRIDYRWGFRDDAVYSILQVLAPAPRKGVLALLDGPTFDVSRLPTMPPGLSSFTAFSISPEDVYARFRATAVASEPNAARGFDQFEAQFKQGLKLDFRNDLLGAIGPKMVFYADLAAIQTQGLSKVGFTAEVRDGAKLAATLGRLATVINAGLKDDAVRTKRPMPTLEKTEGETPGYSLTLPAGSLPPGPLQSLRPTLLVSKSQLAIGLSPADTAKVLAAAEGKNGNWAPAKEVAPAFAKLPGNLIVLSVDDPRATMPQTIAATPLLLNAINAQVANARRGGPAAGKPAFALRIDPASVPTDAEIRSRLFPNVQAISVDRDGLKVVTRESMPSVASPGVAAVSVALLLPAVQAAREAARRAQCTNNEKQIGLALHNYHSTNNGFPAASIASKDGKPLLSWRVAILPFLAEESLYKEYHLDEAWDSPHNKALIARMPKAYLCPSRSRPEPGTTTYRGFVGGGALFDLKAMVSLAKLTDGSSNTIAVVETTDAVPWTKPEDIDFDPKSPPSLLGAGSPHPGGFNTLFADGSVRFILKTIDLKVFRSLITRAGGEQVGQGAP